MKTSVVTLVVLLLLTTGALAQHGPEANVPRMNQAEFSKLFKAKKVTIVDVRTFEGYKSGHIPGALSIPLPEVAQRWEELPRDKPIVAYCS